MAFFLGCEEIQITEQGSEATLAKWVEMQSGSKHCEGESKPQQEVEGPNYSDGECGGGISRGLTVQCYRFRNHWLRGEGIEDWLQLAPLVTQGHWVREGGTREGADLFSQDSSGVS